LNDLKTQTPVALNAQVLINKRAGGSCNGGNPGGVYAYANKHGIPDSSCEQYVAKNLDHTSGPIDECKDCRGPPCPEGQDCQENCWAVENYTRYYSKNHYSIRGKDKMKAEIYKNGPIACGVHVSDAFEEYSSGIYTEPMFFPRINHEISVVGFGIEDGVEYWIGRNSWGSYWGENGMFRMKMGKGSLGIETDCSAGIPTYDKPNSDETIIIQ